LVLQTKTNKGKNTNAKLKKKKKKMKVACISYVIAPTQIGKGKIPSKRANLKLKVGRQEGRQVGDKTSV
jgi:hypothetical protein